MFDNGWLFQAETFLSSTVRDCTIPETICESSTIHITINNNWEVDFKNLLNLSSFIKLFLLTNFLYSQHQTNIWINEIAILCLVASVLSQLYFDWTAQYKNKLAKGYNRQKWSLVLKGTTVSCDKWIFVKLDLSNLTNQSKLQFYNSLFSFIKFGEIFLMFFVSLGEQ